jgi:hypothetical protein
LIFALHKARSSASALINPKKTVAEYQKQGIKFGAPAN